MRMLDLFCGRGGWTNAFLERGWEVFGVDLVKSPDYRGQFWQCDVMQLTHHNLAAFDFICASSPCQEFSLWGMPHFWPNPKYPEDGIRLFNGTRVLCESAGKPYVMENVRSAQRFVGKAVHHCGPFYLWGNGVPVLVTQGITKGMSQQRDANGRRRGHLEHVTKSKRAQYGATIPPELAHCVAEYAERICGQ